MSLVYCQRLKQMVEEEPKRMRGVKITWSELPQWLPPGERFDFKQTPVEDLRWGDIVVLPSGRFARVVWQNQGRLWVADASGRELESFHFKGTLYRAEVAIPLGRSRGWLLATLWAAGGQMPQWLSPASSVAVEVQAEPRQLWRLRT